MNSLRTYGLTAAVAVALSGMLPALRAASQEFDGLPSDAAMADDESSYRTLPPPREEKLTLARQKAVLRGQQRMARLEAMKWYGFSGARPTAAAIPFTAMYSPAWQMPGGRPFAWYTSQRPIVIYAAPNTMVR